MTDIDEQRRAIREGLAEAIREYYKHHFSGFLTEPQRLLFSDAILKWEADHGAVLKVDTLPNAPPPRMSKAHDDARPDIPFAEGALAQRKLMKREGYTRTAPLIAPEGQQDSEVPGPEPAGPRG